MKKNDNVLGGTVGMCTFTQEDIIRTSKFLSLILRHKPEIIGLAMDDQGWAKVDELIELSNKANKPLSLELLKEVVDKNDKKRFTFSSNQTKIRAAQGHSRGLVNIEFKESIPPEILYHGTALRFVVSIMEEGLTPQSRHHVHLSQDKETAKTVGERHGTPALLKIDAALMQKEGHKFYLTENGVWLSEEVPPKYIIIVCYKVEKVAKQ